MRRSDNHGYRKTAALALALALLSACAATTPTKKVARQAPPARIDIQEAVGFTITEKNSISGDVRLDYEQAVVLLEQGQPDRGIQLLESVVAAAPNLSVPRIDLGVAYHQRGDLEAAEEQLTRALETNPSHPVANNELGIIYRKTGRFAEARSSYEAALETYPNYHYARRNLAVLCDLYLGDLPCALNNYEAYMATVPNDEEASMWIADLRYRMGQE